jgi:inorganic pyrophosphatase
LSDDGDPIDVLVVNNRPLIPGCVINCRPIGILQMKDEAGMDEKIIAVPSDEVTAMYSNVKTISDLPQMRLSQVSHFFERYKDLESEKWVEIVGFEGADVAKEYIQKALDAVK